MKKTWGYEENVGRIWIFFFISGGLIQQEGGEKIENLLYEIVSTLMRYYKGAFSYKDLEVMPISELFRWLDVRYKEIEKEEVEYKKQMNSNK